MKLSVTGGSKRFRSNDFEAAKDTRQDDPMIEIPPHRRTFRDNLVGSKIEQVQGMDKEFKLDEGDQSFLGLLGFCNSGFFTSERASLLAAAYLYYHQAHG